MHLFPLNIEGSISVERLRSAWEEAARIFDILRTSFHFLTDHGVWVQVVHSVSPIRWIETGQDVDLSALNILGSDGNYFHQPPIVLHFQSDPANDRQRLFVTIHHSLYDGFSLGKLFAAVRELYRGHTLPSPIHFHDLLPRLLYQEAHGTRFWVQKLQKLNHAPIPKSSISNADVTATVHYRSLNIDLSQEQIDHACRLLAVTSQSIGLAAYAKLLALLTQNRDVIFGRVVSGRDLPNAEDVLGPTLVRIWLDCILRRSYLRVEYDPLSSNTR